MTDEPSGCRGGRVIGMYVCDLSFVFIVVIMAMKFL